MNHEITGYLPLVLSATIATSQLHEVLFYHTNRNDPVFFIAFMFNLRGLRCSSDSYTQCHSHSNHLCFKWRGRFSELMRKSVSKTASITVTELFLVLDSTFIANPKIATFRSPELHMQGSNPVR